MAHVLTAEWGMLYRTDAQGFLPLEAILRVISRQTLRADPGVSSLLINTERSQLFVARPFMYAS